MNLNVKKLVNSIVYAATGLFAFIFLAFDFVSGATVKRSVTIFGSSSNRITSFSKNGYSLIGWDGKEGNTQFEFQFFGVIVSIFLVIIIIASIALLAIGAVKMLDAFGLEITFLTPIQGIINSIVKIFSIAYMSLIGFTFIVTLFYGLFNIKTNGKGDVIGFWPGIGIYLLLFFAVAVFVVPIILDKLMSEQTAAQPRTIFVCTQCGKRCANGAKFCDACGGAVAPKVQYPVVFVCSQCGKKATPKDRFCVACGGAIERKEIRPATYACSACGKPATAGEKFCGACGGPVVSSETPSLVCSQCGKPAAPGEKFCGACGGTIIQK